jgi:hypothetical protein
MNDHAVELKGKTVKFGPIFSLLSLFLSTISESTETTMLSTA